MKRGHWALAHLERIVGLDGAPYLTRLRVVQTPLFGLYLHRLHRGDWDRHLHSHPWAFASVVLRGGYYEELATPVIPREAPEKSCLTLDVEAYRGPGRPRIMRRDVVHRIVTVEPNTWTLVAVGRRRDDWGFYVPGRGMVPWRTYLREQGHPQADNR